ncbi:O-antigen ligase family protein [Alkalilimnicola sp. S0819]|uniref:O-antigen ligase family protein n=1 Tax=Alkalilimnicola sp. S0819 TaxID=2613922 RepID=UPI0012623C68|nr:O-antigen ligase family protein [Alkalilimnicola sp. S0819]KAB7622634.1 hypothetical protein F3N43_12250 [Alkalilimnicola sp. S0819]MPQ17405.1 hypothetical protein [Alkalilimnicola sp. S0819]
MPGFPPRSLALGLLSGAALLFAVLFNGQRLLLFSAALSCLLLALLTARFLPAPALRGLPRSAAVYTLAALWLWLGASTLWSEVGYLSAIGFWWFGALPLAAALLWQWQPEPRPWRYFMGGVLALGLLLVLWQLWQLRWELEPSGPFLNKNSLAAFLNLILLATLGLLAAGRARGYALIVLLALGLALVGSRGALLGLGAGLAAYSLALTVRRQWRSLGLALVSVLLGLVLGELLTDGLAGARLASLAEPGSAGADRFVIWESAWRMFLERPWLGWGLGTFWVAYPPFRQPADGSGGFYVHNDYLQFAVEAGWPGLLLLTAFSLALLWLGLRYLHRARDTRARTEFAGLWAGLLAVGVHTLFTFNFYILAILLLAGLYVGRLLQLAAVEAVVPVTPLVRPDWLGARAARLVLVLLAAFPLLYFLALGSARYQMQQAQALAEQGQIIAADRRLQRVQRLLPGQDAAHLARAGLMLELLGRGEVPGDSRRQLQQTARALLDRAARANPLRAQVPLMRARLGVLSGDAGAVIESDYRQALALDPLHVEARTAYAVYLLRQGQEARAARVLEAGLAYRYPPHGPVLAYLRLAADVRLARGDEQGAAALRSRADELQSAMLRYAARRTRDFRLLERL